LPPPALPAVGVCFTFCFTSSVLSSPSSVCCSASGFEAQRIEEMEKMLKEAQQEKARLMENRVSVISAILSGDLPHSFHISTPLVN